MERRRCRFLECFSGSCLLFSRAGWNSPQKTWPCVSNSLSCNAVPGAPPCDSAILSAIVPRRPERTAQCLGSSHAAPDISPARSEISTKLEPGHARMRFSGGTLIEFLSDAKIGNCERKTTEINAPGHKCHFPSTLVGIADTERICQSPVRHPLLGSKR